MCEVNNERRAMVILSKVCIYDGISSDELRILVT